MESAIKESLLQVLRETSGNFVDSSTAHWLVPDDGGHADAGGSAQLPAAARGAALRVQAAGPPLLHQSQLSISINQSELTLPCSWPPVTVVLLELLARENLPSLRPVSCCGYKVTGSKSSVLQRNHGWSFGQCQMWTFFYFSTILCLHRNSRF